MDEPPPAATGPPPVLPYTGGPRIACPYCGWPEFYRHKRLGVAGIVILILGVCLIVGGIPCLAFAFIGVYPIGAGLLVGVLGIVLMFTTGLKVNRCRRCRRSF